MNAMLRGILEVTPFFHSCRNWWLKKKQSNDLLEWEKKGRPAPVPDIVKQRVLKEYAQSYDLRILVETGTCYGDMVEAMKDAFETIYSIELSHMLFSKARLRFQKNSNIHLLEGDSAKVLGEVVKGIDAPALFWLDAHYSADVTTKGENETPIYDELNSIFRFSPDRGHVIIIDDARCFGKDPGYPTLDELKRFVLEKDPNVEIAVLDDSIRIIKRK